MIYLTSTIEQSLIDAEAKISENCGFPFEDVERWAIIEKAYNQDFWFMRKPIGYSHDTLELTESQMMADVDLTNITEKPWSVDWYDNS